MANIMQDGSYVLSDRTEGLKGFERELEAAHLVGEWQIPRQPDSGSQERDGGSDERCNQQ